MAKKPVSPDPSQAGKRQALLDAAAEVFALRGFAAATVREICEGAGANIASVNYHFGDKEALYTEVLKYALRCAHEKYPPTLGLPADTAPEVRLRAFVESFLMRVFDDGRHSWHARLMSHEMVNPSTALDDLVKAEIRPLSKTLDGIVKELLGGKADEETVRVCALSVVSQCTFYHHCRPVLSRLFPDMKLGPQMIRRLAQHITRFSLAGIREHANAALQLHR